MSSSSSPRAGASQTEKPTTVPSRASSTTAIMTVRLAWKLAVFRASLQGLAASPSGMPGGWRCGGNSLRAMASVVGWKAAADMAAIASMSASAAERRRRAILGPLINGRCVQLNGCSQGGVIGWIEVRLQTSKSSIHTKYVMQLTPFAFSVFPARGKGENVRTQNHVRLS